MIIEFFLVRGWVAGVLWVEVRPLVCLVLVVVEWQFTAYSCCCCQLLLDRRSLFFLWPHSAAFQQQSPRFDALLRFLSAPASCFLPFFREIRPLFSRRNSLLRLNSGGIWACSVNTVECLMCSSTCNPPHNWREPRFYDVTARVFTEAVKGNAAECKLLLSSKRCRDFCCSFSRMLRSICRFW